MHEGAELPVPDLGRPETRALLLGLGLATGMEFYNFDALNLVLRDLRGSFGVSADEASWILTVYSSALFLCVPVSVWLAAHVGYKRFLLSTVVLYAGASFACSVAGSFAALLCWRAVQGASGAGLIVWWRASIYLLLPKAQRSAALMRVSTLLYLSSALGLLLGGYLTDALHWRLIFLPDAVYSSAALYLLYRYFPDLPRPDQPRQVRTDGLGILLLAIALIGLQIVLNRGDTEDWFGSARIRLLTAISSAALLLFLGWQSTSWNPAPLLQIDLLRDRRVLAAALLGSFTGMILSGSLYVLPEFLRSAAGQDHSATQTGRILAAYALTAALIRPAMVPLIGRIGQRKAIMLALCCLMASMFSLSRVITPGTPDSAWLPALVLYACCLAPLLPAVGSGTVARIEQNRLLDGVSLYMTFRQFGASLGIALIAMLSSHRQSLHSARLYEHLGSPGAGLRSGLPSAPGALHLTHALTLGSPPTPRLPLLASLVERQVNALASADVFLAMTGVAVLALLCVPIIPAAPAK